MWGHFLDLIHKVMNLFIFDPFRLQILSCGK